MNYKKYLAIFSALIILISFGCEKADKLTQFEMEYTETVIIPSSTGINLPFNFLTPDISTNAESTFEVNDTRKDMVEEINLIKLDLTHTSPAGGDLGFLKSIKVYISAEDLPEKMIASKEDIPSNVGKYLEIETSNENLKDYIIKDKFSLRVNTVTDEAFNSDQHIDVHTVFFVDAKVLGN